MQYKMTKGKGPHLVIIGFDDIVSKKYFPCIKRAIDEGVIDSYSVIELVSEKGRLDEEIAGCSIQPVHVFYLPNPPGRDEWANRDDFEPVLKQLQNDYGKIKVYIATELKAHEQYLRYCIENAIDSLVEKPVLAPIQDGMFDPDAIEPTMRALAKQSLSSDASHSVMTLSRYHEIYSDHLFATIQKQITELEAPLTSLHLQYSGGVWNRHDEYHIREDHPYKYGYGMIMHGGYHYIDLFAQLLELNSQFFPRSKLRVTLSSYAAFPKDQQKRIPSSYGAAINDDPNSFRPGQYGETDIVTTITLEESESGETITLGSLSLEQTTPCMRNWEHLPESVYNRNGRLAALELEAKLSTLYSIHVSCIDEPSEGGTDPDSTNTFARVYERANASLLPEKQYFVQHSYDNVSHGESNRKLLTAWLYDQEGKSKVHQHLLTMRLTQYLALSIQRPGYPYSFFMQ